MNSKTYHIIFDIDYYKPKYSFGQRRNNHPTWHLQPLDTFEFKFGGKFSPGLNHLITIDKQLEVNGIELQNRSFGIDFEQLFNGQINGTPLSYQHLENGNITRFGNDIEVKYQYCNEPLKLTKIRLANTPEEYYKQEWEGNCNRIGGSPIWVQEPEMVNCPKCNGEMTFIFQLDSGLPDLNESNNYEIMFGNDGMCYAFWCDKDKISRYLWQCT